VQVELVQYVQAISPDRNCHARALASSAVLYTVL
jgi:hypothetical protein